MITEDSLAAPRSKFPFEAGIVRFAHPAVLIENGAEVTGVDDERRVVGPHLFVIAATKKQHAVLAVVYSNGGARRVSIPPSVRSGHPAWLSKTSHLSLHQLWFASKEAIEEAARAAGDASWPDKPNRISFSWLREKLWIRFQELEANRRLIGRSA